jgi:FlaA1/EpsC-like NDP-sugar epimerase
MNDKKTVLVTGGTGFLGRNLARALTENYRVVLSARDNKQMQEAVKLTGCEITPLDVTNIESVRDAVNEFKPHIIIHAAATKYVDFAERFPMECVDINILGSQNVARVAVDKGIEVVLGISTDKASPPIRNMYGMSKAIMERIFCSMNGKSATKFACVRYGNVAWSTGSVLPIWQEMWDKTQVIGATGPEMRRFFFTIDEAVELVMTGLEHIDEVQGKVLSREMKSAQIEDILRVWVASRGGRWEKIAGRPGERTDEYLIGEIELPYTVEQVYGGVKHYIISFNEKAPEALRTAVSSENAERLTDTEILELLHKRPMA